jgi:hypothetical protein
MNREEELEMELQRVRLEHATELYEQGMKNLARMYYELNKARREEREACAKLCTQLDEDENFPICIDSDTADAIADAIRARGDVPESRQPQTSDEGT